MRLFVPLPLTEGAELPLPEGAARHAMVRRVQPGDTLTLFDGSGSDWPAHVLAVGRSSVSVRVGAPTPVHAELPQPVTVALAMPANERMDWLVEKATELGVSVIQPLHSERSVLRLAGERATRKQQHWQAVAQAACEQCGRAVVPQVAPVAALMDWLRGLPGLLLEPGSAPAPAPAAATAPAPAPARWLLSLQPDARPAAARGRPAGPLCTLSGPEGGLTPDEEAAAHAAGFMALDLGPRVLRAETAPLAVLAWLALQQAKPRQG